MGNFPTKAEKEFNNKLIVFPAKYYKYFTSETLEHPTIAIRVSDAVKIFSNFSEETKDFEGNRNYAYMNVEHMLRVIFKISTDQLSQSAIRKLKSIAFYIPAFFLESEKTENLSEKDENIPDTFEVLDTIIQSPAATTEIILEIEDKSEQPSQLVSLFTLPSSHALKLNTKTAEDGDDDEDDDDDVSTFSTEWGSVGTDGTTSSKQSRRGPRLTHKQKTNEVLNSLVMSECRITAILKLKDALTPDESPVNGCAHAIFLALLEGVIPKKKYQKGTCKIIQEITEKYSDGSVKAFSNQLVTELISINDDRPGDSEYDLLRFLSRFSTVLRGKQSYFFDVPFSSGHFFIEPQKILGKTFEEKAVKLIKKVLETSLTPLCNAAIYILRHPKESDISSATPAERFHLIARLIYNTSVLHENTKTILANPQFGNLANTVLEKLKMEFYSSYTDTLEKTPNLNQQKVSANCFAFIFKECIRQLLRLEPHENLEMIRKTLQVRFIQNLFLTKAEEFQAQIEQSTSSRQSAAVVPLRSVSATLYATHTVVDIAEPKQGFAETKGAPDKAASSF